MSKLPAIQHFCVYAALSVLFIYVFHCTAYCALLALDEKRMLAGRWNWVCCVRGTPPALVIPQKSGLEVGATAPTPPPSALSRLMGAYTGVLVSSPAAKGAVLLAFLGLAGASLASILGGVNTGFVQADLTPDVSYLRDFLDAQSELYVTLPSLLDCGHAQPAN